MNVMLLLVLPLSGVVSLKLWKGPKKLGAKCLTLGEQQYFCLGRRSSKHKMTLDIPKIFGGHGPLVPPGYAYASSYCIKKNMFS